LVADTFCVLTSVIHRFNKRSLNMRLLRRWFSQLGTSPMALRLHVEHSLKSQV